MTPNYNNCDCLYTQMSKNARKTNSFSLNLKLSSIITYETPNLRSIKVDLYS